MRAGEGQVTLTARPRRLLPGDWTAQGLPFYSGRIDLTVPVGSARRLCLAPVGAATLAVRHPGGSARQVLPWAPFETALNGLVNDDGKVVVECVLTRRNTFGPLHLMPIEQNSIGPRSFRSEGEAWSDQHQLVPVGLRSVPQVV